MQVEILAETLTLSLSLSSFSLTDRRCLAFRFIRSIATLALRFGRIHHPLEDSLYAADSSKEPLAVDSFFMSS